MGEATPQTDAAERPASACDLIAALKEVGPVKVWSLLVTVFGDLSAAHGGFLTSRQLNGLFTAFDIQPGALRVALHRLRKDGWIESERAGRSSLFRMTALGQHESDRAREVIYRAPGDRIECWALVISRSALPSGVVRLSNETACLPASEAELLADAWVMPMSPCQMPEWMMDNILSRELREVAVNLGRIVDRIEIVATDADPYHRMALRTLILHHWRRIALRNATWLLLSQQSDDALVRCFVGVHRRLGEFGIEKLD